MDLIIYNANVMSLDHNMNKYEAIGIVDNKIASLGSTNDLLTKKKGTTKLINLEGRTILPGFNDSHMHLLGFGASLCGCLLNEARSISGFKDILSEFEINNPDEYWLTGRGWNQDYFIDKRLPNRHDLDQVVSHKPVVLRRACGHILVANTKAIELSNICDYNVEGGAIDLDDNGYPTGIFRENGMDLILKNIPEPSKETMKKYILAAGEYALSQGITSVQSDDLCVYSKDKSTEILEAFTEMSIDGELPVRVYEQSLFRDLEGLKNGLKWGYHLNKDSGFFKLGPVKILADGSLGARTAFLREPYSDADTRGISVYTEDELNNYVLESFKNNLPVAIHGIGDGTIEMALKAIKNGKDKITNTKNLRNSIIHCQITDDDLIEDFSKNSVTAMIQPIFLDYDIHIVKNRVGEKRASRSYAFKTMLDMGVHVTLGSDCPVESMNVFRGIKVAVTRKDLAGFPDEGYNPSEALTVTECLIGYTRSCAYSSYDENVKGTIEVGKYADLTVLSQDITLINPSDIDKTEVLMTIIDGKIAYNPKDM